MVKYIINSNIQKEVFPDGDIMIYDALTETIHILNQSAALMLELIQLNDLDTARQKFVINYWDENSDIMHKNEMELEFDHIIEDFVKKGILTHEYGNTAVI